MTGIIAIKEIRHSFTSFTFMFILLIMMVTMGTSLFIMYNDYSMRVENYELLKPEANEPVAITRPTVLSIFAKGLDEDISRSYKIDFKGVIESEASEKSANGLFAFFPVPDMLYVIKVVISLCTLFAAFALVSGEKENRTLTIILANNVSRASFVAAQWIGAFVSFIVPFILFFLAGVLVISQLPYGYIGSDELVKLAVFLIVTVLYLACFFSLGLLASCLSSSSATSLVIALLIWCISVFAIPGIGNSIAGEIKPVPSSELMHIRHSEVWIRDAFTYSRMNQEGTPFQGRKWLTTNEDNDKLRNSFMSEYNGLIDFSRNILMLSPAAVYTFLATDIAGTGIEESRRFKESVTAFKDLIWLDIRNDTVMNDEQVSFSYTRMPLRRIFAGKGLFDSLILLLFTVLAASFSLIAFLRYDIR